MRKPPSTDAAPHLTSGTCPASFKGSRVSLYHAHQTTKAPHNPLDYYNLQFWGTQIPRNWIDWVSTEWSLIDSRAVTFCVKPPRPVGRPGKRAHAVETGPERLNKRLHLIDQRSQRQCVVCHAAGRKARPIYYCKTCPDMPQLCPECFERFHTLPHF